MKKTIAVTGASGAIGKATVIELAKKDCRLILLGRSTEKLRAVKAEITRICGNEDIHLYELDLSETKSIKKALAEIHKNYQSLDGLINIAAIFKKDHLKNSAGLEYMFATNHLGPFILTNGLLDLLKAGKPSRIVTVSGPSTTKVNFDDLQGDKKFSAGFMGSFGASKMMNLMFTYALARRIEGTGVSANVFHPGLVKTDLTKEMSAFMNFIFRLLSSEPDKAAAMLCRLMLDSSYENENGKFFKTGEKEIKSSAYSYDREVQEKLWTVSEELASD